MKKITFALIFTSLLAAGCNYQATNQNSNNTNTANTNTAEQMQTYHNSSYGIEFQYPETMQFVTSTYAMLDNKVAELQIPQTDYPNTNFGDAAFSVSTVSATSLDQCLKMNAPENGDGFKTQTNVNGRTFYMTKSSGAAAGNRYDSTVYRTLVNQTCYELLETIHTSAIENYPAGTVSSVDPTPIQAKLDSVLNTFQINQ